MFTNVSAVRASRAGIAVASQRFAADERLRQSGVRVRAVALEGTVSIFSEE